MSHDAWKTRAPELESVEDETHCPSCEALPFESCLPSCERDQARRRLLAMDVNPENEGEAA